MSFPQGSLEGAHAELVALERTVWPATQDGLEKLTVYPFEPRQRPAAPCIFNWIVDPDEESRFRNAATHRDVPIIRVTLAVRNSADSDQEASQLLRYTDKFRDVIDPALERQHLGGCAIETHRLGLSTGVYQRPDGLALLCMNFPIRIQLDRRIP